MATAAVADPLVVRSDGPSAGRYRPGTALPENGRVTLAANDTLTLLNDGGTWTLRGPGTFPTGAPAARTSAAPRVRAVSDRRVRVGAVRTVEGISLNRPNLWMIDVEQPGKVCVVDPTALTLWRAEADAASTSTLTGPDGVSAEVAWAAGQASQDWPAAIPVVAGGAYRLSGVRPVAFTLEPLNATPASVPDAGRALIEHGCTTQLNLLVGQLENEDAGADH